AFVLQIPDETRSQQFEYEGNGQPASETALDVRFADGDSNRVLLYALAFGVALLGWWLRNARTTLKAGYLFLVIVVPIAVIGLIPGLYETALFGVLLGGVMTIAAWLLLLCAQCCQWCRDHFSPISSSGIKLLLMAALLSSAGLPAFAAEPVSKTGPQVAVPPPLPDPVRDPYVVIPYESLEDIDQADKVWVPADLYRKLWRAAHPNEVLTPKSAQGLVAEANYVARLTEGDSPHVEIQARWVLVNLTNRAITIPLPIQQPGLMDVQKNGEPVPLIVNKENAAAVVLHESGVSIIDATLMLPADVQRSVGQFQLALSPVGAGVLTFELPASEEELAVRVNGSTGTYRLTTEGDQKRVEIPVDAGGKVAVNWQPEAQQGNADQLVQVQSAITLDVSDLGIQQRCGFRVTVRQGGLNDLSFELPEELAVKGINGQDIAGWERVDDQSPRQLKVFFRRTISDSTDFTLDLFQDRQLKQASETVNFPLIAPLGVTRETGALSIAAPDHLRVRVTETNGLQQIDLAQYKPTVSPSAATSGPVIAYRFSARPISITAELSRREAEVRSLVDHGVDIGRRKIIIASRFQLELQGTPQRLLTFSLPDGYLTMDVVCQQAVDWYEVDNGGETQLVIELQNPITGSIEVGLEGHLVKDPEDATVSASVPAFAGSTRQTVSVGVWFDDLYQASLSNSGDWRAVPVGQLSQGIRQLQSRAPQFGFRTTEDNGPLEFQLRRATPELTADEATLIAVTDATIDYGFTIRWNIANAAADEFAFTVPDWLGTLEIAGPGIRQVQSTDAGGGRTRWTISLVDPVREQYLVTAAATVGTPQDFVVQTPAIEIESATGTGSFEPLETQRTFAVLVNLSGDQLVPVDLEQFESVAVDQLPLSLPDALVRQAMEITRTRNGRSPSWRIQRLETADAAQAVVLSATLTTVLEMDGSWRTNAVYGIRNRGQQFLGLKLPEESRILSVFVRGVPSRTVLTSVNNEPVHLVALPQTSEVDLSFDVNVLLEGRLGRSLPEAMSLMGREVRIPVPQVVSRNDSGEFGLSVAQTLWTVHVPDDLDANPVREPKATNLTWHAEQAWIAQERQRLSRLESDLNEMMRIASDAKAGYSRRNAAISNLKKLKRDLANQSEQASSLDASGPVQSEANELAEENRKLSELVQETIDSNSDFDA
ncbi:MAG: hypothetical protein KDA80_11980, partial [Planctomycetaceae bacterium]|nr:hypothetical protein [Planctomycetaceae bacterium]